MHTLHPKVSQAYSWNSLEACIFSCKRQNVEYRGILEDMDRFNLYTHLCIRAGAPRRRKVLKKCTLHPKAFQAYSWNLYE
eukprot:604984-Hanusia_phi.AAC.1